VGWGFSPWRPGGLIAYAEDLMAAQVARGHDVSYFMTGRHYPFIGGPRLKRWKRGGVAMHEVVNSPMVAGLEHGTREPDLDISEPRIEAAFARVLAERRPEVLHIQELHALPSSVIEIAHAAGVPMLMTLQDYGPLCTTLRLFDSGGAICRRREIGADCLERNAEAPTAPGALIDRTIAFEVARARERLHMSERVDFGFVGPLFGRLRGIAIREGAPPAAPDEVVEWPPPLDPGLADAYQRRREVNVERLGLVDRLIAQSPRVAQVYRSLGVRGDHMSTMPFTLGHVERLHPRSMPEPPARLTFATLNGAASQSKGSHTIVAALRALRDAGLEGKFRLRVLGHVDPAVEDELAGFDCVELRGLYRRDELDSVLDDVDVGVIPSMWEEALGYIGLELIAKGIPVIANPLGGIVEYAREGQTAWLNGPCTGEGLAEIMAALVRDPAEVVAMHERLMAVREEVAIPLERHVDAIDAVYRELVTGPPTHRGTPAPAGG
jgi:glycosyltransferase involved in cell wall biosynthesis